jgi:hypothetical protein
MELVKLLRQTRKLNGTFFATEDDFAPGPQVVDAAMRKGRTAVGSMLEEHEKAWQGSLQGRPSCENDVQ